MRLVARLIIGVFVVYLIDTSYFDGAYFDALSRMAHELSVQFS
jgi:hypothetical protein